jgi:hypothetical protein
MDISKKPQQNELTFPRMITQDMIPPGEVKPRHLAPSTTMKAGDMYYVGSDGVFHRLAPGTVGQKLTIGTDGLPKWA